MDAGSGSGRDSFFFAENGRVVSGIDISEVGVEKAKARATEKGLDIDFRVGGLEQIDFPDNHFDAVYSGYTLQETDISRSIPELARVLKSGQVAYIAMFESTKYDPPTEYDHELNHDEIINIVKQDFEILKQATDEYEETDQHGKHKHKRLVLVCRKNLKG